MEVQNKKQKSESPFKLKDLPIKDKNRLVDAFVWLINEDKKQKPELYKINSVTR